MGTTALPIGIAPLSPTAKQARYGARRAGMPTTADAVQMLSNPQIEDHPQPVCVHLYRTNDFVETTQELANLDCRALIQYACGASAGNSFICDWRGQFPLVCSSLIVSLVAYTPFSEVEGPIIDLTSSFGVHLGLGAASGGNATFTSPTIPLALSGDRSSLNIPKFARRYYPLVAINNGTDDTGHAAGRLMADADLDELAVEVWTASSNLVLAARLTPEIMYGGLLLPMHAARVVVANRTLTDSPYQVTHLFELAL